MAAPPEVTLGDLTGDWVMNKALSDDPDPVLALQGVSWIKRTIIARATVTLHTKQYTGSADDADGAGATHIDIDQTLSGGINGSTEKRTLDWVGRSHYDDTFGDVVGRSRWLADLTTPGQGAAGGELDPFLVLDWLEGEGAGPQGERFVQSYAVNASAGWAAEQIWGFALVDGRRYYTRRVVVRKGAKVVKVRLVYDWKGKPEAAQR